MLFHIVKVDAWALSVDTPPLDALCLLRFVLIISSLMPYALIIFLSSFSESQLQELAPQKVLLLVMVCSSLTSYTTKRQKPADKHHFFASDT